MVKQDKALVLGGTLPHATLVKKLKERGYYTILVDYTEHPPAALLADLHVKESTLDKEKVLELAISHQVKLVISTCIDQANVTACFVAEQLDLPKPYAYSTSLAVTDKLQMKSIMVDNNIPTSKFYKWTPDDAVKTHNLKFPVIIKPADSNSSKGVKLAATPEESEQYVNEALAYSRSGKVILEEFVSGKEIGIDGYVQDGKATLLMVKERRKIPSSDGSVQQIFGCTWPDEISRKNHEKYRQLVENIAIAFGLDNTPLMVQAIVKEDKLNVIEFAPRIGESFRIIHRCTGFDFVDAAIASFLGEKVSLEHSYPDTYFADNFIYTTGGEFGTITGHENLLEDGTVLYLDTYKTRGTAIGTELSSNNRVGVFSVRATTPDLLKKKIQRTLKNLKVLDIHGRDIFNRDIYRSRQL
jgi:carbamoylphosphate synthase large subunit